MALFINANGIQQNGKTTVGFPGGSPLFINNKGISSSTGSVLFNNPNGNVSISTSNGITSSAGGNAFPTRITGVTISGSTTGYAPGAPTNLVVSTPSSLSLVLSFTGSTGATGYEYTTNANDQTPIWVASGRSTSFTTGSQSNGADLVNNTYYQIAVRSTNSNGNSSASNIVSALTIPAAPSSVSITSPGQLQLAVTYTGNNNNSGQPGYGTVTYQYTTNGGANWATLPSSGTAFSNQSTGSPLVANTSYTVQIRANNTTGSIGGMVSVTPNGSAITLPPQVSGVNVIVPAISQQLTVNYTVVSVGNQSNTYEYNCYPTNGLTNNNWLSLGASSSNITTATDNIQSPLQNGTSYTISVRAVNNSGSGPSSISTTGTPAYTLPQASLQFSNYLNPPNPANPAQIGQLYQSANISYKRMRCVNGSIPWTNNPVDFTMNGSNYWTPDGTAFYPFKHPLSGLINKLSINIWAKATYNTSGGAVSALLYDFNGETNSQWLRGYMIGGTSSNTSQFQFTFGVRSRSTTTSWSTNYSSATVPQLYDKNLWYMITFVVNDFYSENTTYTLYINGAPTNNDKISLSNIDTSLYNAVDNYNQVTYGGIGTNQTPYGVQGWVGNLSNISEYANTALTDIDVMSIFNSQKSNYGY